MCENCSLKHVLFGAALWSIICVSVAFKYAKVVHSLRMVFVACSEFLCPVFWFLVISSEVALNIQKVWHWTQFILYQCHRNPWIQGELFVASSHWMSLSMCYLSCQYPTYADKVAWFARHGTSLLGRQDCVTYQILLIKKDLFADLQSRAHLLKIHSLDLQYVFLQIHYNLMD